MNKKTLLLLFLFIYVTFVPAFASQMQSVKKSDISKGPITLVNTGDVCVRNLKNNVLKADKPILVTVTFDSCGSPCFDVYSETKCSVSRKGNVITINSQAIYERKSSSPEIGCIAMCAEYKTQCEGPALKEGNYTISSWREKIINYRSLRQTERVLL